MNRVLFWGIFTVGVGFFSLAQAQTPSATSPASPQATPSATAALSASTPTPSDSSQGVADSGDSAGNAGEGKDEEKPFIPHWSGQLGITYSNQPSIQGQAQTTEEISMTGTYNLTENSTYVSAEIAGGEQTLEGNPTNYGSLTLEGAWGFGFFQPSLSVAQQEGAAALNETTGTLTLNFQLFDPLTAGLIAAGGLESHQGPVTTFSPLASHGDTLEEGDSYNWTAGLEAEFAAWDFLSFTLTGEEDYDYTYQFQNINHTVIDKVRNQYDRIVSLTLAPDLTLSKEFSLEPSFEYGWEYEPAGVFYSPVRHRTLFNAKPTEQNFQAFSLALMYNFE